MMSVRTQSYEKFQRSAVESASPDKLLGMLFEGAIRYIHNAGKAIEANEVKTAHDELIKAEDIVLELMSTLNMDYDISHNLIALYDYIYQQLVQANLKKEVEYLEIAESLLTELRDTFQQAALAARMESGVNSVPVSSELIPEPEQATEISGPDEAPAETAEDKLKQSYDKPRPGNAPPLLPNTGPDAKPLKEAASLRINIQG